MYAPGILLCRGCIYLLTPCTCCVFPVYIVCVRDIHAVYLFCMCFVLYSRFERTLRHGVLCLAPGFVCAQVFILHTTSGSAACPMYALCAVHNNVDTLSMLRVRTARCTYCVPCMHHVYIMHWLCADYGAASNYNGHRVSSLNVLCA